MAGGDATHPPATRSGRMKAGETGKRTSIGAGARAVSLAFSRAFVVALVLVLVLAVVLVFGAAPARAQAYGQGGLVEPNPVVSGNATVSSFLPSWGALQYTSTTSLPAKLNPLVKNPVQVTAIDVVAPGVLQAEKIDGAWWNATASWSAQGASYGAHLTGPTAATVNGEPAIQFTLNQSTHGSTDAVGVQWASAIPASAFPSANPAFDFITFGIELSGPSCSSCYAGLGLYNSSGAGVTDAGGYMAATGLPAYIGEASQVSAIAPVGGSAYVTESLAQLTGSTMGLNLTGVGKTTSLQPFAVISTPSGTSTNTFTADITELAFTTAPMTLGNTIWGAKNTTIQREAVVGVDNVTAYAPDFTSTSVAAGGYTVAIAEEATTLEAGFSGENATVTTSPISVANATAGGPNYVEQATYYFTYELPTAATVSYGSFHLVDTIEVAGAQYVSVSFGGTSYTATYQGLKVGQPTQIQASVTPTSSSVWIGVVEYTGSQWDSISTAPGLLSSGGLEYLWFELLGALLAIGGAAGGSAWVISNKRALQQRRGVARVGWVFPGLTRRVPLRKDPRGMSGRHGAALALGLVTLGAGAIALWSWYDGADAPGLAAAFVGGWLILIAVAGIGFLVYEVYVRVRKRR